MQEPKEIRVSAQAAGGPLACRHFWSAVRKLFRSIGHDRLPEFVKIAAATAESAGRVTWQARPAEIPAEECGALIVLSANLWHDWPRYRDLEKRLEAFAALVELEKADVILLQELARTSSLKADLWLAGRLRMAHVYSRANGSQKIGFEEGLGILSRFPLKPLPHVRQLSRSCFPFSRRLALGVEVETPCGALMAFSVHLGLMRKQNAYQLEDLQGWVSRIALGRSAVIAGDFNAPEHSRQIRHARSSWQDTFREIDQHGRASTHEIRWPWGGAMLSHRLDYIFLQPGQPGWKVIDVRHVDSPGGPHSDHRAVVARFAAVHAVA